MLKRRKNNQRDCSPYRIDPEKGKRDKEEACLKKLQRVLFGLIQNFVFRLKNQS